MLFFIFLIFSSFYVYALSVCAAFCIVSDITYYYYYY